MHLIPHILLFALAATVIWTLSGMLVAATDRVAKRYHRPGFGVAFFILGILTSISELSVATNATLKGVPQVSAGNLVGGTFVIFLLIIPLLATLGGGIAMKNVLTRNNLLFVLFLSALPAILLLDGNLTRNEGIVMILLYMTSLYFIQKRKSAEKIAKKTMGEVKAELLSTRYATFADAMKIVVAAALIFIAGKILVDESIYFSIALSVPASLVGLILLSVGTNVPELTIAIRCIISKRGDIAFGDYLGSAAANTLIMGMLAVANGPFGVEQSEFIVTFVLLGLGLALFYWFSRSKNDISRKEGIMLLVVYAIFLLIQLFNVIRFANDAIALK